MLTNCMKRYPLSLLAFLVVVVLSVCPIGAPEFTRHVPLVDKWTHMVMYGFLAATFCFEYVRVHRPSVILLRLLSWGVVLPALIGGALELIQNYCTTYRSGEWLDFVADSIGAAIVGAIVVIYVVCKRK